MSNNSFCQHVAIHVVFCCALLSIQAAHGADIDHKIRQGSDASASFEPGVLALASDIPVVGWIDEDPEDPNGGALGTGLLIDGRAEWKGLVVETYFNSFSAFSLGYSLSTDDKTSIDLIFSEGLRTYESDIGEYQCVENRSSDLVAGIRATHHFDAALVQIEAYSDVSGRHAINECCFTGSHRI
ncbi:MAG: hypothetical protein AB8B64_01070 [Granulosicoccus sp.]